MAERESRKLVEVAAGTAERQLVIALEWRTGLTAEQAVRESGILAEMPELAALQPVYGLFGTRIEPERYLEPGDRVELCRPLVKDPRDMRRELLSTGSVMGQGKPWSD